MHYVKDTRDWIDFKNCDVAGLDCEGYKMGQADGKLTVIRGIAKTKSMSISTVLFFPEMNKAMRNFLIQVCVLDGDSYECYVFDINPKLILKIGFIPAELCDLLTGRAILSIHDGRQDLCVVPFRV